MWLTVLESHPRHVHQVGSQIVHAKIQTFGIDLGMARMIVATLRGTKTINENLQAKTQSGCNNRRLKRVNEEPIDIRCCFVPVEYVI